MRILFINNDGGGFADYVEVVQGTTVDKFFCQQLPGRESADYLIRVNRQPVPKDYTLQDGDRVTLTPTKIEGAARLLFINNDGGGFADYVDVAAGTTVDKFFCQQLPGRDSADYRIRVNRQPVPKDYVLQDNDRVTMTPTKIEGAQAA
jgi:molybdopterin converting factor small subunit